MINIAARLGIKNDSGIMVMARVFMVLAGFWAFLFFASLPIAYFTGQARAEYLQNSKGVTMHWYKAAWLPSEVFIDAKIRND